MDRPSFEQLIKEDRAARESKVWRGPFLEYLDLVREDPSLPKLSHARIGAGTRRRPSHQGASVAAAGSCRRGKFGVRMEHAGCDHTTNDRNRRADPVVRLRQSRERAGDRRNVSRLGYGILP